MVTTAATQWLNTFFSGYDNAILSVLHSISCGILTFLFKLVTLLGEKGIIFFLIAFICMCFSKTRKFGVCLFGAVACGALITNIILKDMIARPRPFEANEMFRAWWRDVGSPMEDDFSFPSGHVTAAAAGMTAICLLKGKKWIAPAAGWIVLMMIARNYLMAHYPSDVLAGAVIGVASGFIAYAITKIIFSFLKTHEDNNICSFCLDFDLPDIGGIPSRLGLIGGGRDNKDAYGYGYKGSISDNVDEYSNGSMKIYAKRENKNEDNSVSRFAGRSISKAEKENSFSGKDTGAKPAHGRETASGRSSAGRKNPQGYVGKHEKR